MSDPFRSGGEAPPTPGVPAETEARAGAPDALREAAATSPPSGGTAPAAPSGGRRWLRRPRGFEWVILVIAAIVAWKLWDWRGGAKSSGKPVEAPITLVTSDREDLACAYAGKVGQYRCEFEASGKRWPNPPAPHERLAPYYTTDRQLYLIPGLFEQSALAARYASESPSSVPRGKQKRFVARCQLKLLERVERFQTRWLAGGPFGDGEAAWVAEPVSCKVTNE